MLIKNKNDDLAAGSRRKNLHIVAVPESVNTGRIEEFVENLLTDIIGKNSFSEIFVIDEPIVSCVSTRHRDPSLHRY